MKRLTEAQRRWMAEYKRRPEVRARQNMLRRARQHDNPRNHRCTCGNVAAEWDSTTNAFRCADCAWCERQEWAAPWGARSRDLNNLRYQPANA